MKSILLGLLVLSGIQASATVSPFENITADQPICYGREYSKAHLDANKIQTVKKMRLKFSSDPRNPPNLLSLGVEVEIKRPTQTGFAFKPYKNDMTCQMRNGDLACSIDCDGGSATVTWGVEAKTDILLFKNKGIVVYGGCGSEDENADPLYLTPTPGGDDVFKLYALPNQFCQD